MPPRTKFNREDIVEAALEISKQGGLSSITARSVAKSLGSSVAPIYVNFETIEDLIEAVVQRIFAISGEQIAKQTEKNVFESIGKASIAFAREYPVLFRELMMKPNNYMENYDQLEGTLLEAMARDGEMGDWTMDERRRLLFKMRAFQTGLSAMIANDHVPSWIDNKTAEEMLMEMGEELVFLQKIKREEKTQ
jgi:AcrR family transcriptional regulator